MNLNAYTNDLRNDIAETNAILDERDHLIVVVAEIDEWNDLIFQCDELIELLDDIEETENTIVEIEAINTLNEWEEFSDVLDDVDRLCDRL